MRAIRTTPAAIIQQIRNNLRDNYGAGFSLLKELLQNADDAGAQRVDIVFVPSFPPSGGEGHPLLTGPAICVLNDARFRKEDAEKIALLGEGSKSGNAPAIGKFGLGLKSVFHLCEAFFYVASREGTTSVGPADFINPWADTKLHTEWNRDLTDPEVDAIVEYISPLIQADREWFCLVLPLRMREQLGKADPLFGEYPGDEVLSSRGESLVPGCEEKLFGAEFDRRIAALMPMLKRLAQVNFWRGSKASNPEIVCEVRLGEGSLTTEVEQRLCTYVAPLEGKVTIKRTSRGPAANIGLALVTGEYVGMERWLDDLRVQKLCESSSWPRQTWTDPDTGDVVDRPEKAIPHVAVYLFSASIAGTATFGITPAVFLPLGDAAGSARVAMVSKPSS